MRDDPVSAATMPESSLYPVLHIQPPKADEAGQVRSQLTDGLSCIEGDRVELQQVLLSLIVNALKQ